MILTTRIVTIYPVFLKLIEQIGVKIGYGKVMSAKEALGDLR